MDVNAPTMTRIAVINKNRLFFPNIFFNRIPSF